ncbi:Tfp pilus assembly protein PilX [Ureibacillus xyleni]|uniref:Tfp pilus assembly protein PilX n=1 Tax=Ureibacillus xyleni TaxID=614648 RepID=A0A285RJS7_9BACL|nr:hypothetical protein [Ureibacillus xyleni]SOB93919.1 Tfp pilus assembly protein PilX [Ureibacillus xyleni]
MYKRLIKYLKNQDGFSMVIALMTLVLLSIIGISMFSISNNTTKASERERDDQAVYYIAEAGLVNARAEFKDIVNSEYNNLNNYIDGFIDSNLFFYSLYQEVNNSFTGIPVEFEPHFTKSTSAIVTVTGVAIDKYEIKSIGKIGQSNNARAVSQTLIVSPNGNISEDPSNPYKEIDPSTPNPGHYTPPTPTTPPPVGEDDSPVETKPIPDDIKEILKCDRESIFPQIAKGINGGVHTGDWDINKEDYKVKETLKITGDLIFNKNDATLKVEGDLIIDGDLIAHNKVNILVTGKLIVKGNINLHNKTEITVLGNGEINDIKKDKGSDNHGFVCIKGELVYGKPSQ